MLKKIFLLSIILFLSFSFFIAGDALAKCKCYCGNETVNYTPANDNDDCKKICNTVNPSEGVNQNKLCENNRIDQNNGSGSITIKNPLSKQGGPMNPEVLYGRIITGLLSFVGIASLAAFVYAGFIFLISAGNPERVKKAKDVMVYAVIGVVVSMASYAILSFIFKTLEGATGN
ncbi:MAG: pilin [Candidatus Kuenenbacteria bacterium]